MYSFALRAHQRIDRAAFRQLRKIAPDAGVLTLKGILHFEGERGPDAKKLKKGESEPPWHLYIPGGDNEEFFDALAMHYDALVDNLRQKNIERAAFEASWLAHVLVDGLTPAHHFPYKEALEELYGKSTHERQTLWSHFYVNGITARDTLLKSMRLIGPKGVLTNHTVFEAGAAAIILPLSLTNTSLSAVELKMVNGQTLPTIFKQYAHEINSHHMFERFIKSGWTIRLARDVRLKLAPQMVRIVALAWYSALCDAGLIKP